FFRHCKNAEFIDRTEAILERTQDAETTARLALKIKYGIDHVLEHARTGDAAFFGHMTNEKYTRAAFFCEAHKTRCGFADLTDRAGCRGQQLGPNRLNRIYDEHFGLARHRFGENAFDRGFGECFESIQN